MSVYCWILIVRVTQLNYMKGGAYCRKCDTRHQRSVGRRFKRRCLWRLLLQFLLIMYLSCTYHVPAPPASHVSLQPFQQLPVPMPVLQQPQRDEFQQQSAALPTLNTLKYSAVDKQLIQERLQQLKDHSVPQRQGELLHCCDNNNKKKRKWNVPGHRTVLLWVICKQGSHMNN